MSIFYTPAPVPRLQRRTLLNVTPFTYRDGLTWVEVLERLRRKINELIELADNQNDAIVGFTDAVQELIDTLQSNYEGFTDDMEEKYYVLLSQLVGYTVNLTEYEYHVEMMNGGIWDGYTKAGVDNVVNAAIGPAINDITEALTGLINDAIESLTEQINSLSNDVADAMIDLANATAEYDARISAVELLVNNSTIWMNSIGVYFVNLTSASTTVTFREGTTPNYPLVFVFKQNAIGGNMPAFPENVIGLPIVNQAPNAETRIVLYPNSNGQYVIDHWKSVADREVTWVPQQSTKVNVVDNDKYNTFPCATSFNSNVYVAFEEKTTHTTGGDVKVMSSTDGGKTFSGPVTLTKPVSTDVHGTGAMHSRNGIGVLLTITRDPARTWVWTRANSASAWVRIGEVVFGSAEWVIATGIIWLKNGVMLASGYGPDGVLISRSTDNGLTWTPYANPIPGAGSGSWPYNENVIQELPDGRLIMLVRHDTSSRNYIRKLYSSDGGATWGAVSLVREDVSGMPRVKLMSDNSLVLIVRDTREDGTRESWGFMVSTDLGNTWTYEDVHSSWSMYGEVVDISNGYGLIIAASQVRGSATNADVWTMRIKLGFSRADNKADTGWIDLNLAAGWTATLAQYRIINGIVYFRGTPARPGGVVGTSYEVMAYLPVDPRPRWSHVCITADGTGTTATTWRNIYIHFESGEIRVKRVGEGGDAQVSLAGITPYPANDGL